MDYINKESIVSTSDNDNLILTTHRIRYQREDTLTSIMLDQITGISIQYKSKPGLLAASIVLGLAGLVLVNEVAYQVMGIVVLIIAAICLFAYLSSRKHIIDISTSGKKIQFHTSGIKKEKVLYFMHQIERSRHQYLESIHNIPEKFV